MGNFIPASHWRELAIHLVQSCKELNHVDPNRIYFFEETEKKGKKPFKVHIFPGFCRIIVDYVFGFEVSLLKAMELKPAHLVMWMYKELRKMDFDEEKLHGPDVMEFSDVIERYGWDWEENEQFGGPTGKAGHEVVAKVLRQTKIGDIPQLKNLEENDCVQDGITMGSYQSTE